MRLHLQWVEHELKHRPVGDRVAGIPLSVLSDRTTPCHEPSCPPHPYYQFCLRQWPDPHRPSGRIYPDRHLGDQKLRGHEYYLCALMTPTAPDHMLRAEQDGLSPEQLIDQVWQQHRADFAHFLIEFDNYYSTHSPENRHYAELIYHRLNAANHISRRPHFQFMIPKSRCFCPIALSA